MTNGLKIIEYDGKDDLYNNDIHFIVGNNAPKGADQSLSTE